MEIPGLPDGQISGVTISESENQLAFLLNSSNASANLYIYDFNGDKLQCLTDTLSPEIDQNDLVEANIIHYESFNRLSIPAIYYEPITASETKVPALVWVHGGPGGQSMVDYNPIFYMVLAALAFKPNAFKVGVDVFGVSNWERTLKEIPAWWESILSLNILLQYPTSSDIQNVSHQVLAMEMRQFGPKRSHAWFLDKASQLKDAAERNPFQYPVNQGQFISLRLYIQMLFQYQEHLSKLQKDVTCFFELFYL
ncbi:alpha/beta hydrolase family protein [Lentibacillus jeotgali]|uniref:alpha/beta hydrolase family protein n=1 Tax=Lentibacillus jeotgali TaxID=558169 RepID=UPI0002626FAA|nr:secreted prolyl oligopeptidase [Lentibacillus jeotgali]